MAGISHTVIKCLTSELELSVDIDNNDGEISYTISMGTGFTCGNRASVNIETPRLSREEFLAVIGGMQDALKLTPGVTE